MHHPTDRIAHISTGWNDKQLNGYTMRDRSDDPSHHEQLATHKEGRKELFYLTTHSTHFIYGYMASYIW